MIATLLCTISLATAPAYTVSDAQVSTIFAGQYGRRILTTLTLKSDSETVVVYVQDVRYTKFERAEAQWMKGEKVRLGGRGSTRNLRTDDIRRVQ